MLSSPGSGTDSKSLQTDEVGNFRMIFTLPRLFRQDYSYSLPNGMVGGTVITCLNGDDVWLDNRPPDPMPAGMSISMTPPAPPDAAKRRSVKFMHARYLLALLLYTGESFPISFTHTGKAEISDGRADILDGQGPDGFSVQLFLDEKTHRPLLLSYAEQSGKMVQLRMEEYKETSGILVPHLITWSIEGKLVKELRLENFILNDKVDTKQFYK